MVATDPSLDLNNAAASKALLTVSGDALQHDLWRTYKNGIAVGEIACASGYEAPCDKVFVVTLPAWEQSSKKVKTMI